MRSMHRPVRNDREAMQFIFRRDYGIRLESAGSKVVDGEREYAFVIHDGRKEAGIKSRRDFDKHLWDYLRDIDSTARSYDLRVVEIEELPVCELKEYDKNYRKAKYSKVKVPVMFVRAME